MAHPPGASRPICDYEGSGYKEDFWISGGREYEDLAERHALTRLLPARGRRLLEIGAGFGRLASLYAGYEEVVLLDYSRSLLEQARAEWGADPRFTFVAADLYDLPFFPGQFDAVVMVRVIHHLVDVPQAFRQVQRVLAGQGSFILEFANKRNLKAILRYLLRRQAWNPFDPQPVEFVRLNFDFHPAWMLERAREAGFRVERTLALSHFRLPLLKRAVPPRRLARLDAWLQPLAGRWPLSPSVMLRLRPVAVRRPAGDVLFRCLACGDGRLLPAEGGLRCAECGRLWPARGSVFDFKPDECPQFAPRGR